MVEIKPHPEESFQILVVDDTPANLKLLTRILTAVGYQVRPATSGRLALRSLAVETPDLILLDVQMPEMDGYEVCTKLKSSPLSQDIPVIFISALDALTDKVRGFSAGGVDYITKPFQSADVLARVEIHLRLRSLQKQLESQNVHLQQEIYVRTQIEEDLKRHKSHLEEMISERTADLTRLNLELQQKIAERRQAEDELRQAHEELETQVALRTLELRIANKELSLLSHSDGLTTIANRRYFDEFLNREWQRASREGKTLALLMVDIDFFKAYNDTYGHQAGDDCLKTIACTLKASMRRATDLVARYGGEEFVIVLPDTDEKGALAVAEKLRRNVEDLAIEHRGSSIKSSVTISLGAISLIPTRVMEVSMLVAGADKALYQAKGSGRNCTKLAQNN